MALAVAARVLVSFGTDVSEHHALHQMSDIVPAVGWGTGIDYRLE
jgi:hypothetical protein